MGFSFPCAPLVSRITKDSVSESGQSRKRRSEFRPRIHRIEGRGLGKMARDACASAFDAFKRLACENGRGLRNRTGFAQIAVAMQGEIDTGGESPRRAFKETSAKRHHRQIVAHQQAVESDLA